MSITKILKGFLSITFIYSRFLTHNWSLHRTRGSVMVGLVTISSVANKVDLWAALLLGFLAGFLYIAIRNLLMKLKLDDPSDSISIHAFGGLLGVVVSPILARDGIILYEDSNFNGKLYFSKV